MEELEIQSFNFCTVDGLNPISLNAIETKKGNFIIVTYTVAADVNNPLTYNDYLMLIDLNGNIYSKTLMSPSLIDSSNNNNTWIPQQSFIYPNANNKQGFLYFAPLSSDGSFSNIAATVLTLQVQPSVVSTVDGGYMFIYPNVTTSQDPYSSQTGLYAMYCGYGSNIVRETVILYENMMYLNIVGLNCFISYSEVGQICLISIQSTTDPNPIIVNIQVSYLSRGTVFDIKHVNVTLPTIINDPNFTPLPFGGYLYSVIQTTNMSSYIWGYVLDENGNLNQWDLSYPTLSDSNFPHQILTNNTLVILQPIVGQNWSLITTDLYKIHEVRLTKDGTSYFDTLNSNQINKFFNNLTQELADAVAVTSKRIITNYRFVIDTNIESSSKQYLLSIKIDKPQSASDRETKLITKDLDIMIRNMDITVLASGSSSKYLEPIYGYVTIPRWYENSDNICQLILTVIFILILTILCIISIHYDAKIERREVNERRDVDEDKRQAASKLFFLRVPYVIKLGYAVYIILNELVSKENSEDSVQLLDEPGEKDDPEDLNDQQDGSQGQQDKAKEKVTIKKWLEDSKDHKIVLVMLISLAGTDVGIIIGETIGIIIKNMPDLAFRVYFLSKAIDFSYLSILTPLVSLIKILSLFTNFTKLMKTRNYGS
ncbi:3186_t:CDS:10 [Rhizophagus irregularis]|nr:3186_t:CDS:10 [Rhizophagus irregularis]